MRLVGNIYASKLYKKVRQDLIDRKILRFIRKIMRFSAGFESSIEAELYWMMQNILKDIIEFDKSIERFTDETALVRLLCKDHPVKSKPQKEYLILIKTLIKSSDGD